jgi:hypothetical protein
VPFAADRPKPDESKPSVPSAPQTPDPADQNLLQRFFGGFLKVPINNIIDESTVPTLFNATFTDGAATIGKSGTKVGENANSAMDGQASAIGGAIGRAAAAIISQATVKIDIPGMGGGGSPPADRGPIPRTA